MAKKESHEVLVDCCGKWVSIHSVRYSRNDDKVYCSTCYTKNLHLDKPGFDPKGKPAKHGCP